MFQMNKTKWLFMITMIMGTILTMSSNNWINCWMGLELNMISFIPLMSGTKSKDMSESSMMYYLVQSVSSMIFLFSIIMMSSYKMQLFNYLMTITMMIKLGAAPFHMWIPEIMSKMKWENCILLMTWQKLAPLMIINNMNNNINIMMIIIMLSVTIGGLGGVNQASLRKILGYSSIHHSGWILSLNKIQNNWIKYMMIYSMIIIIICYLFMQNNVFFINQMNNINMSMMEKLTMSLSFMSLGGLPPFLGFLPKWMVIQTLIMSCNYLMLFIMIMSSLIMLYYYLRITIMMMINHSSNNKWMYTNSNEKMNTKIMMINLSLPFIVVNNFM